MARWGKESKEDSQTRAYLAWHGDYSLPVGVDAEIEANETYRAIRAAKEAKLRRESAPVTLGEMEEDDRVEFLFGIFNRS